MTMTFEPPSTAGGEVEAKIADSKGTSYVVLVQGPAGEWALATTVTASSADQAIRLYVADLPTSQGTYVAVPERSWKPRTLFIESKPVIKFT